jgi:hypothetical protein
MLVITNFEQLRRPQEVTTGIANGDIYLLTPSGQLAASTVELQTQMCV